MKKTMNKKLKTTLIVVGSIIILAVLTHLCVNYVVPFIIHLHGTAAY